jgi:serine protease Do
MLTARVWAGCTRLLVAAPLLLLVGSGACVRHSDARAPAAAQRPSTAAGMPAGSAAPRPEAGVEDSIPDLFARVAPAVVFITAASINPYQVSDRVERVSGSGLIIDGSGLVLTNAHVAFGRQSIVVALDDGTTLPARLVGADPIFDVAVLRVQPPKGRSLPVATLGDSDRLRVGEEVLAIGNPLGLDQTLTRGIVSATQRILPESPFSVDEPLIQTDTPINPGNSGGPLLNRRGEVIGITTAIIADAENIGFAIPIDLVKRLLPELLTRGHVVRPWVGFQGQLVPEALRELLRIPMVTGLMVEVIEPGSPAERAGLHGGEVDLVVAGREFLIGGDIVTHLNGTRMDSPAAFSDLVRGLKVGDTVSLRLLREGKYREVRYVLPERPLLPSDLPGDRSLALTTGRRSGTIAPPPPEAPDR